jgi:uncharacterized protein (DUF1015 family)
VETVLPFRAWRYAPTAGDPDLLVAPPYDVIGPDLQSRLYARSPHNVVRLDLGMTTLSDSACDNRYTRAASQLEEWKKTGVLERDQVPALTFVQEEFTGPDGRARVRHGFLAALRLHDFSEGIVYPHEQTFSGPKADRFELMHTTAMSLSPVFLLYDLPGDPIISAWSAGPGALPPAATITSDEGTVTKLWSTSDPALLEIVARNLENARFVIADGHHRYETALLYRDHRRQQDGAGSSVAAAAGDRAGREGVPSPPAYEYVLAYLSNMADPGLAIYATHRLVAGVDPERLTAIPQTVAGAFAVEPLTPAAADAAGVCAAVGRYLAEHPRGAFGVWVPAASAIYGLRLFDGAAVAAAAPGHSRAYQRLDVTILQKLIFESALGIPSEDTETEERITYFKDTGDAFERLERGEFQAGFFMNPTGLEQVREVALAGERMPQKATFFYPKLPTGLVFQDLSGSL